MSKSPGSGSIIRSIVAWSIIAVGLVFIYLSVGQLLALFVTPAGMSSSPRQAVRDFVGQYGQGIGLLLITAGQWIRGRRPRLKLRRLPRLGKAALLIALIATTQTSIASNLGSIVPVFAWGGWTHRTTLTEAAIDMAASYNYMGIYPYKEMAVTPTGQPKLGFGEDIAEAAVNEDQAPNDNYHFYYPADGSGLKWEWYFPIRAALEPGYPPIDPPPGGVFTSAYVRARSGFGYDLGDKLNWCGALKAYDYTPDSKQVAYTRLGHVAHLLEDMAAPDHANLVPHPGSAKSRLEIYSMVASLVGAIGGLLVGGPVGGFLGWLLGKAIAYVIVAVVGERYGFEKLVGERSKDMGEFLPPPKPEYRASLKAHFDLMATDAETESADSGLLPLGRRALGVDDLWIGAITWPFPKITLFPGFPTGIPLLPAIDPNDAQPYHDLTDSLGTKALARTAGLLMWFYDIVDFPPYVKQVSIMQGGLPVFGKGELKYKAEWQDMVQADNDIGANRVVSRIPNTPINKPLESGKPAVITVIFGPIGGTKDNPVPKKILRADVKVGGKKVDVKPVADNVWEGEFTPQLEGCKEELQDIEIFAVDRERHHVEGSDEDKGARAPGRYGDVLDSDPASPAKLRYHPGHWPEPPYEWYDADEYAYTPGWDKDHYKVAVRPNFQFASVTPSQASLIALDGQSFHFTISIGNGPANVKLKAVGVPPGAQAEFHPSASVQVPPAPQTVNVILKITVSSATPVGSYKIQIVEEGYTPPLGLFALQPCYPTVTLTVKPSTPLPPSPDFTILVDPSNSTVEAGGSTATKVIVSTVTLPLYADKVLLSFSTPPGFTIAFMPAISGNPPFETMMQVKVASTVEAGKSYQITVTGTGGDGKTHSAIFTIFVKRPFTTADFGIKVNPSSGTVQAGFYTTAEVVVTTSIPDWYPYTVTLYASAPSGWLVTFAPPPASGQPIFTKLMQVTVPKTAQSGSYTVTITGVGTDFKTHHVTFTVFVTAPPPQFGFTISVSPALQNVIKGQTASYTIAITIISGSTQPVNLNLRGLPSGVTFNFRPSTGNPTFTSTLMITTTPQTPRGDYTLTIVASGGGVTRSATVTLRVVEPFR